MWAHQAKGVALAFEAFKRGEPHYAYFFEQGTGKTRTTIELMRQLFSHHKRPLRTLILCPAIVVKNWKAEIERYAPLCSQYVLTLTGDGKKRRNDLNGQLAARPIVVTNLEALATVEGLLWESKTRGKDTIRVPRDLGWEMLIVDEAHRLKNPSSKSFKMAVKIADKCFFKYELTGTPIANNEMDLFALFRILDGGKLFGKSFQAFKREWFIDENAGMPAHKYFPSWRIRPGSQEVLGRWVYTKAMRVTKEECLDLPPLVKKRVDVELSPKQRRVYDDMKCDFIAYVDSGVATASLAITKALRLMQIVSGFVKLEDGTEVSFPDAPRLAALSDYLTDVPGKVIIWCVFQQNYRTIARVCEQLGRSVAFITGEQSQKEKDKAELEFTKGDVNTLIANPAAGGTGVNLVEAADAVWYSRNFKMTDRLQAIARNHRGGSEMHSKITMVDLVAPGTMDEHVLHALDHKEAIAEAILAWKDRC